MMSNQWRQIEDILNSALECDPAERAVYLDANCGTDAGLRAEVESLLACEAQAATSFIETPAFALAPELLADDESVSLENRHVGAYKILREIGRGGMGVVFLAERSDGEFQQQVALKLVWRSFADAELARRFRRERQILASLNHPNIARLLDGGVSAEGEPFFAMEHVEGVRIDDYCTTHNLSTDQRLKLFLLVCQGVAYAHQHLVVHRDLKPSNILVTNEGTPKLLDFGIAKLLDAEHAGEHTQTYLRAFTPDYASPEQISGARITTASDVFSLGILLHELLHGAHDSSRKRLPLGGWLSANNEKKTLLMNSQTNQEHSNEGTQTGDERFVNHELKNIIAMARREEPARRYASVPQFAEDIQRYLDGLPVRAQQDSFTYRTEKFVRRNRFAVASTALVALSLVFGFAVALWQANVARVERDRAERRFTDVRQLSNALLFDIAPKIERVQGSTAAREALVNQSLKYLDSLARESADDSSLQSELAAAYEKVGDLQGMPSKPNLSDFAGAIASYEKAQLIRRKFSEKHPEDAEARRLLAKNLREIQNIRLWQTDAKGSLRDLKEATAVYESLLANNPESLELRAEYLDAQLEQALNLYENAQFAAAIPLFQNILPALEELNRRAPDNTGISTLLVRAYKGLSLSLSWESRQAEGEAVMARALPLAESLVAAKPNDVNLRHSLWDTYTQASSLNEGINDKLSFEFMQKALRIVEETIKMDEANIQARHNLASTYSRLGAVSTNLKQSAEALSYLEKAIAILTELEAKEPRNLSYKRESGKLYYTLGEAHRERKDFPNALRNFEKAGEFFQTLAGNESANTQVNKRDSALALKNIADIHRDLAQAAGENQRTHRQTAKENYQRSLDIFLQLQSSNALAEFDRKYLEEVSAAVRDYEPK